MTVLVDDDKLFVFLTKKTIEATNFEGDIREFGDGREALDYLKEIADKEELLPDIIFLDLSMPVMDGWQLIESIRGQYLEMDRVIVTGWGDETVSDEIRKKYGLSYIYGKPLPKDKLENLILEVLRKRK